MLILICREKLARRAAEPSQLIKECGPSAPPSNKVQKIKIIHNTGTIMHTFTNRSSKRCNAFHGFVTNCCKSTRANATDPNDQWTATETKNSRPWSKWALQRLSPVPRGSRRLAPLYFHQASHVLVVQFEHSFLFSCAVREETEETREGEQRWKGGAGVATLVNWEETLGVWQDDEWFEQAKRISFSYLFFKSRIFFWSLKQSET